MREYPAKCIRVLDGDTIECEVDVWWRVKMLIHVRLARIDACELKDKDPAKAALAAKAKRFLETAIMGSPVTLKCSQWTMTFERYVMEVEGCGTNLSDELLKEGLAKPFKKGSHETPLAA